MAFRRRSLVLTGAAISVVALGILTNLATIFMPEDALPPLWLIWAALNCTNSSISASASSLARSWIKK